MRFSYGFVTRCSVNGFFIWLISPETKLNMIFLPALRLNNRLIYNDSYVTVASITKDAVWLDYIAESSKASTSLNDSERNKLEGLPLTKTIAQLLYFVEYGASDEMKAAGMEEFTDGRLILRFTEDVVSVFAPIDMPWATPDFPLQMYYINQIKFLHQLQNLYIDLFEDTLDITPLL